jgi:arylsulfatase A-like enzyme
MPIFRSSAPSPTAPGPSLWLIAVAAGFVAGWLEFAVTVLYPRLTGRLAFNDWNAIWIIPTSYLLYLLPLAAILRLAGRRRLPETLSRFLVLLPAVFGLGWLTFPRLHPVAIVVFALGVSLQSSRQLASRSALLRPLLRRVSTGLAALTLAGALVTLGGPVVADWRARGVEAPAEAHPNVLLLILDTVRSASLSVYGHSRPTTPGLARLASEGVRFEQAFTTAPWTLPSHASIFTGRYPYELSTDWDMPLGDEPAVVTEGFRQAGYRTAGFVGNVNYASRETGIARGFEHYEDWPLTLGRLAEGSSLGHFITSNPRLRRVLDFWSPLTVKTGDRITTDFLRWLDRSGPGRPFFAFLNLFDAHEPYFSPEPFASRFDAPAGRERIFGFHRRGFADRVVDLRDDPSAIEGEERGYEGAIAYLDAVIEGLLDSLDRRGMLQSTIIVISSDHGEQFGEYGLLNHGNSLYPPALRVPLIIVHGGGVPRQRVVPDAVSLRDLPATLLDVAGIDYPSIPGTSLARYWRDDSASAAPADPVLAEVWGAPNQSRPYPAAYGYMRGVVEWPYMLIRRGDGVEELIELGALRDSLLSADPTGAVCARLRGLLRTVPPNPDPGRDVNRTAGMTDGSPRLSTTPCSSPF